jgi:hypothetical protein
MGQRGNGEGKAISVLARMWEKGTLIYTVGRSVNYCRHYGNQYRGSFKNLKVELPYDSATTSGHISKGM